jgi:hypothetical protein
LRLNAASQQYLVDTAAKVNFPANLNDGDALVELRKLDRTLIDVHQYRLKSVTA